MNISLTPELEGFVNGLVESGDYYSASEVIRDSLRLLKEQDALKEIKIEELRREIRKGKSDIAEGRYKTISTPEEMKALGKSIIEKGKAKLAKSKVKEPV